jgi:diguanylate cyclase (GGDEF)-like protein
VPRQFTFDRNIDDRLRPFYEALDAHPAWIVLAVIAATAGIAWLDRATGVELSLVALYLGPVAIMSWFFGRVPGWIWSCVAGVASFAGETPALSAAADSMVMSWNTMTIITLSLVVVETVTRLRRALDTERDLARTDALSGVANARSFRELAAAELERARRYGRTLTLALLDLDHFKSVNDTLGHAGGDRLIHDVGQAIRWRLRRIDTVARVGGDEFAILLPEADAAAAAAALEHVRGTLQEVTSGYGPDVKASFGAVTFVSAPGSVEEMLQLADIAMYQAKKAGGDRVESITISREPDALEA